MSPPITGNARSNTCTPRPRHRPNPPARARFVAEKAPAQAVFAGSDQVCSKNLPAGTHVLEPLGRRSRAPATDTDGSATGRHAEVLLMHERSHVTSNSCVGARSLTMCCRPNDRRTSHDRRAQIAKRDVGRTLELPIPSNVYESASTTAEVEGNRIGRGGKRVLRSSTIRVLLGFANSPQMGRSRNSSRNGPVETKRNRS